MRVSSESRAGAREADGTDAVGSGAVGTCFEAMLRRCRLRDGAEATEGTAVEGDGAGGKRLAATLGPVRSPDGARPADGAAAGDSDADFSGAAGSVLVGRGATATFAGRRDDPGNDAEGLGAAGSAWSDDGAAGAGSCGADRRFA